MKRDERPVADALGVGEAREGNSARETREAREAQELYAGFEREMARVVGLARYKAQRARVDDVEGVVAEWRARCWRVYPRLAGEAQAEATGESGRGCRRSVVGYMCRVMGNLLADMRRRDVARGRVAVRRTGEEWQRTVRADSERVQLVETDGEEWLGMDGVVDEAAPDPAAVAEAREQLAALGDGLARLDVGERAAVVGWMEERSDADLAAETGVDTSTVWRRRRRGIERLRELFREAGWEIEREAARQLRRKGRRERRVRFRRDDTREAMRDETGDDTRGGD